MPSCPDHPRKCRCRLEWRWSEDEADAVVRTIRRKNVSNAAQIAAEMNTALGDGTIMLGSDPRLVVTYLPTGVLPIDVLLKGGLPRGRVVELFGAYSTLKSFIGYMAIATTQADGGVCALVDTEHAYDPDWLAALGGDPDELLLQRPPHGERAITSTELLMKSGVDLIVWDSVAATITKNSTEKTAEDDVQPARLAAFMSRAMPRLTAANTGKTAMLWINQTRVNVGITFGSNETTPGGKTLPYYASYRVRLAKAGKITRDTKTWDLDKFVTTKEQIGTKVRATLDKSKLNTPHREAWFAFDFITGDVDDLGFLIAQGLEQGYVEMASARWRLPYWQKSVHGAEKFKNALTEEDIEWMLEQAMGLETLEEASSSGDQSDGDPAPAKKKAQRQKRGS